MTSHDNVDADNLSRGKIAEFWATVYTNGFLPSGVKVRMLDGADHVCTLPEKRGVITAAVAEKPPRHMMSKVWFWRKVGTQSCYIQQTV